MAEYEEDLDEESPNPDAMGNGCYIIRTTRRPGRDDDPDDYYMDDRDHDFAPQGSEIMALDKLFR